MIGFFDNLRAVEPLSVILRMILAVVCGGLIGIEREFKRRPAGFRTHILICLGAAITILTSQYLCLTLHYDTDMTRLGAQVVAGIGFIGAGTIIVSRHQRVKGLTTAAGLWATAIIGLALGAGFYEGALLTTVLLLLAETLFSKLEYQILNNTPEVNLYIEFTDRQALEAVLHLCQEKQLKALNLEITNSAASEHHNACAIFTLRLTRKVTVTKLLESLSTTPGVISVEEL